MHRKEHNIKLILENYITYIRILTDLLQIISLGNLPVGQIGSGQSVRFGRRQMRVDGRERNPFFKARDMLLFRKFERFFVADKFSNEQQFSELTFLTANSNS